jgi:hypothetical protein
VNLVREVIWEHFRGVQHQLRSQVLPGKKSTPEHPISRKPVGGPWDLVYINMYLALGVRGAFHRITTALTSATNE